MEVPVLEALLTEDPTLCQIAVRLLALVSFVMGVLLIRSAIIAQETIRLPEPPKPHYRRRPAKK